MIIIIYGYNHTVIIINMMMIMMTTIIIMMMMRLMLEPIERGVEVPLTPVAGFVII